MSAAAAAADPAAAPPKGSGKKKLIIIVAVLLLLVLGGGGAAMLLLKKKPVDGEGEDGDGHAPAAAAHAKPEAKHGAPPVFVPLDPFTVNLADRDAERYAQVGITLEVEDTKTADQLKVYMPAIRSNILLLLSHKTAAQILSPEGKALLAKELVRESLSPLGIVVEEDDDDQHAAAADKPAKKKKKKRAPVSYPVKTAHFSNLIVQ